jgi:hypothetical protein
MNPFLRVAQKSSLLVFASLALSAWAVPLTIEVDTPTNFDFTANFLSLGDATATSPQGGTVSVVELAGNEFQFTVNWAAGTNVFSLFPYLFWESHNPTHLPIITGDSGTQAHFHYLPGLSGDFPFADYDSQGEFFVLEKTTFYFGPWETDPAYPGNPSSSVPDASSTVALMGSASLAIAILRRRFAP